MRAFQLAAVGAMAALYAASIRAENDPAQVIDFANRAIQDFAETATPPELLGFKVAIADAVVGRCNLGYEVNMRALRKEVHDLAERGFDMSEKSGERAIMLKAQDRANAYTDVIATNSQKLGIPTSFYCDKWEAVAASILRKK